MANYHPPSAPFFGMPPYPQAFPPQSAPPPPGGGPAYQHAPQLPPQQQQLPLQLQLPPQPPQPHNASGFGQNTSLPQMDFQALGLNPAQLAAVWQQVQNGAAPPPLPFPPPFSAQPGFAPPPPPPIPFPAGFQPPAAPSFPIPPPQALPGITPVPQPPAPPSSLPAPNNRVMEIVNGDREEGELSDEPASQDEPGRSWSRGDSQRGGRGNERHGYGLPSNAKMPSSPRSHGQQAKRSPIQSPPDHVRRESRSEALQHSTIQTRPPANDSAWSRSGQSALERARFDMSEFEDQRRQAEAFLTTLHNCGYGYVDLQMCGLDPKLIKEVWTSLGFPLDQEPTGNGASAAAIQPKNEPSAPPVSRGAATSTTLPTSVPPVSASTTTASAQLPSKPQSTVGTTGTNKANVGSTASPGDRAAYIARLMAAKNNKATAKATITQGPSSPSPAQTPSVDVHDAPQPDPGPSVIEHTASKPANEPPTDPAVLAAQKKEAQNELLRKKIEALKIPKKKAEEEARAKAQAVAASLSANRTPSSSAEIPVRPAQQEFTAEISTPSKGSQSSSIPLPSPARIPGLFMAAATPPAVPQQPQELSALPANKGRKRPVAADFEDLQQARPPTAFKRPFGQSHNEHEQMIIEPSAQQPSQPLPKVGANRNMPPLTNFPSRPNLSRQGSAQSTPPAVHTPISAAKIEDLRRKEEEIAALKKKLAEKERQRLAKAQSSRTQTPATPTHQPPQLQQGSSPSASVPGNGTSQTQSVVRTEPTSRTGTPTVAASAHTPQSPAQSEWKRRRRAEIQSGISAFDADLNSNLSRLEQLRREMEQIEAENKRRQQEKETLINELESLGIDTEGMPHEELRAKKDEIMQQQEEAAAAAALEGRAAFLYLLLG
ncbi:hypothetical protein B0J12DRAFT_231028 [Macrophomina phaseolina]|uniref:Uncharacterized protein n=1 Tax=Macrophomina phaseolina TaxID=35725 RepID=A0ABQ8GT10_9PEZI|nr:hypothetical protein B0J12DRAFT_231028 [Macrophomina phaseolina]